MYRANKRLCNIGRITLGFDMIIKLLQNFLTQRPADTVKDDFKALGACI
jgi:hypothetical protein